jgi:hypothetical protein
MGNSGNINISPPERGGSIPFDNSDTGPKNVSHAPLNLGMPGAAGAPKPQAAGGPAPQPAPQVGPAFMPAEKKPQASAPGGRISGVRTFFTKLHPGAMEFLDEQISKWLKDNPGITVKQTNVTTGEIQGKKVEPNIIITVWY